MAEDPRLQTARQRFVAGDLDEANVLARAVIRAAKEKGDMASAGEARTVFGEIAYDLLRYAEARDQLRTALGELTASLLPGDVAVRQARASLALVLHCLHEDAPAKEELSASENGLTLSEASLDIERARVWMTVAVVHEAFGGSARAREILEAVLRALEPRDDEHVSTIATAHLHLATSLEHAGEHAAAVSNEERCIELRQKLWGNENPRVAAAQFGLARLLAAGGEVERARSLAHDAMKTIRSLGLDRAPRMSTAHATLGLVEVVTDHLEEGTKHFETACAIEERTFGASSPHTAQMLLMLAQVHAGRRNWGKVLGLCKRIVPAVRDEKDFEDTFALSCELDGSAHLALGRARDAAARLRAAAEVLERRRAAGSTASLPLRREETKADRLPRLWALLGRAELLSARRDRGVEALEHARALAVADDLLELAEALDGELDLLRQGARPVRKGNA